MSTVLAKPYAALRMCNHSWVLLPHNSIWGQQIHLASITRTQIGTLLQYMVLGLKVMRPVIRFDIQVSFASAPNPLQELQGLPNLPRLSSWLERFSFSANWDCQKPQRSRYLRLSKPNQCHYSNHQTAPKPMTANNLQLTTHC